MKNNKTEKAKEKSKRIGKVRTPKAKVGKSYYEPQPKGKSKRVKSKLRADRISSTKIGKASNDQVNQIKRIRRIKNK